LLEKLNVGVPTGYLQHEDNAFADSVRRPWATRLVMCALLHASRVCFGGVTGRVVCEGGFFVFVIS